MIRTRNSARFGVANAQPSSLPGAAYVWSSSSLLLRQPSKKQVSLATYDLENDVLTSSQRNGQVKEPHRPQPEQEGCVGTAKRDDNWDYSAAGKTWMAGTPTCGRERSVVISGAVRTNDPEEGVKPGLDSCGSDDWFGCLGDLDSPRHDASIPTTSVHVFSAELFKVVSAHATERAGC